MNVIVVEGDLLDQDVDVIVNSRNRNIIPWWLLRPQDVSGAIKQRGDTGTSVEAYHRFIMAMNSRITNPLAV